MTRVAAGSSAWQRWRYPALAALVVAIVAAHASTQRFSGDFWLHAATVDAVIDDPLSPANPTQSSDAPSPIVSPYTLVLGTLARLLGLDAVGALAASAVALAALFCALLHPVVVGLTGNRRAPFWALAATAVLWSGTPLVWSGYLNLDAVVLVAPYPAMAAWCCVLGGAWALLRLADGAPVRGWATLVAATAACTVLVHPISLLALVALWGAIGIARWGTLPLPALAVAAVVAVAVAVMWPWWHPWELAGGGSDIDRFHDDLYRDLAARAWPLVAAAPVLAWRWRADRRDALVLATAAAGALVTAGWALDMTVLGRAFPLLALSAHTAIGDGLGRLEVRSSDRPPRGPARTAAWAAVVVAFVAGAWNVSAGVRSASGWTEDADPRAVDRYAFASDLPRGALEDEVLLAPPFDAAYLAGLGHGRPVATVWEERLAADDAARRADVERFFTTGTTASERVAIRERWEVEVVLVPDDLDAASEVADALPGEGTLVVTDDHGNWRVWYLDE